MRLFVDSALPSVWEKYVGSGILYGVTTNPLILKKEGVRASKPAMLDLVDQAKAMGLNELQIQISGLDAPKKAVADFQELYDRWPAGVVAKVPFCSQTLSVLELLDAAIPITFTTGYGSEQAIIARAKGARYIAPYYGRLIEAGEDGDGIVDDMRAICGNKTRVLIASIRSTDQLKALAARGHDTFTLSPEIWEALFVNQASIKATEQFEAAARAAS